MSRLQVPRNATNEATATSGVGRYEDTAGAGPSLHGFGSAGEGVYLGSGSGRLSLDA